MNALTLILRLLHVVAGVLWVGAVVLVSFFLLPTVRATGPAGGQFMQHLMGKTKMRTYMSTIAPLAILSGLGLYWRNISISSGSWGGSAAGITYGLGGLAAIIAGIVGVAVVAKTGGKLGEMAAMVASSGGKPTPEQASQIQALQSRMNGATRLVAILVILASVAMAIGRYV